MEAAGREDYYGRQVEVIRKLQEEEAIDARFDRDALFYALLVLTVGPVLLPQIQRLAMPMPDREARWERLLEDLAVILAPR
ncbi:MAG: hypothetical protein GEU90_19410 [Gemmatimonas sp.]|nr:hypothetical protein [Gemmatimonas sp.]